MSHETLTYKTAGVDIDKANELVDHIKPLAKATHDANVLNGIGGFGALYALPEGMQAPVLVSGTDGVGTKLRLAIELKKHDTIGIDLVAMCVNDIITLGAAPLFFLDYYATGKLDLATSKAILSGIATGCEQAGCALIGGETAEMPGMYHGDDYDLSGFCVGAVDKANIIDGSGVQAGDQLIALGSSGPHSNGYSLIRKVIEHSGAALDQAFGDSTLGETLLTPTIIYSKALQTILTTHTIKAMSHITGGGIPENLPRVLPKGLGAKIDTASWQVPEIFQWLQTNGNIPTDDLWRTFNMGVGMILVVTAEDMDAVLTVAKQQVPHAWHIGEITDHGEIQLA